MKYLIFKLFKYYHESNFTKFCTNSSWHKFEHSSICKSEKKYLFASGGFTDDLTLACRRWDQFCYPFTHEGAEFDGLGFVSHSVGNGNTG